jgi:hypothetical protein
MEQLIYFANLIIFAKFDYFCKMCYFFLQNLTFSPKEKKVNWHEWHDRH